jgi:ATP-binding cassette subfamily B protein
VPEPAQPVPIGRLDGRIALRNVAFRYGSRPILNGLDLEIRPGEMIGLVGHSGSGKSTLVNLICRFHDVSGGAIEVDGIDVRRYAIADFRRHIGLVLQEPFLFFGSIAENIAYGKPGATLAEVEQAAREANAHDFIQAFPDGYETKVGERGVQLSGGQRQRVAIARAILRNPRILLLDEATSSLDLENESLVLQALDRLMEGRTCLIVAHRLSTVRRADRIYVMQDGVIVEADTHDALSAKLDGVYRRLAELH